MAEFPFHIHATDGDARAGRLATPRGDIATPALKPQATTLALKAV
jgi:queuine tRNA-ribosyltransferase